MSRLQKEVTDGMLDYHMDNAAALVWNKLTLSLFYPYASAGL